jgi:UDP-N-acetyl-D-galactosamine dehydrogenase
LGNSNVKGGIVTVLGLTFKENVPDLRNTRVVDIIHELKDHGMEVQVYDPHVDAEEAQHEYGLTMTAREALKPADAVVFAVAHEIFKKQGWPFVVQLLRGGRGVVTDVKGTLPRGEAPAGITLWRL